MKTARFHLEVISLFILNDVHLLITIKYVFFYFNHCLNISPDLTKPHIYLANTY